MLLWISGMGEIRAPGGNFEISRWLTTTNSESGESEGGKGVFFLIFLAVSR